MTALGVGESTLARRIAAGELQTEREPWGSRYRLWVLVDDDSTGDADSVSVGAAETGETAALKAQVASLETLVETQRGWLVDKDLLIQMLQAALPPAPRRRRWWWPWGKAGRS